MTFSRFQIYVDRKLLWDRLAGLQQRLRARWRRSRIACCGRQVTWLAVTRNAAGRIEVGTAVPFVVVTRTSTALPSTRIVVSTRSSLGGEDGEIGAVGRGNINLAVERVLRVNHGARMTDHRQRRIGEVPNDGQTSIA